MQIDCKSGRAERVGLCRDTEQSEPMHRCATPVNTTPRGIRARATFTSIAVERPDALRAASPLRRVLLRVGGAL